MTRIYFERRGRGEDLRRWFDDREFDGPQRDQPPTGFSPAIDVLETSEAVEIVADLPGTPAEAISVLFRESVLLISGIKRAVGCGQSHAAFHLAERSFGRFSRAIRFSGAFDASRAEAILQAGELRITIPRIAERRGAEIRLTIKAR